MLSYLRSDKPEILAKIRDTKALDDDTAAALKDALTEFGKQFALSMAMASLKALKIRIGSVKSTQKITKALNMVAAAKLRRAQQNASRGAALFGADDRGRRLARLADHAGPAEPEAADRHGQGRHPPDHRRDQRSRPCRRVQQQHRPRRAPQGRRADRPGQDGAVLHRRPQGPPGAPAPLSASRSSPSTTPAR